MEELKRTRRITIAAIVGIVVLIIAFISYKKPFNYSLSAEEMAYELLMTYPITPDEAMELMWDSTIVFVDLRDPFDYQADHLENAYNIPVADLLEDESLELFSKWKEDSLQVVLYGNNELEVTSPWMVLYQLGYTNTQTLMGGMDYIDKLYSEQLAENETYNVEAQAYDYAGIIEAAKNASPDQVQIQQPKKVIIRKKEKKAAEGGC
jgi:rhodanese-related sulfurtransferase